MEHLKGTFVMAGFRAIAANRAALAGMICDRCPQGVELYPAREFEHPKPMLNGRSGGVRMARTHG